MIKNFADLKRAIQAKTPFLIVEHYTRPEFSQKIRIPTVVLNRGFYSIVKDSPDATETLANNGKGIWMEFGWNLEKPVTGRLMESFVRCLSRVEKSTRSFLLKNR